MELLSIPLAILVSLLWYYPGIRAQGANRALKKGDYVKTIFLFGLLYACGLIIITEVIWDAVLWKPGDGGLVKEIISDFFRAALLEEFFKLTGFLLAKRSIKPWRKIDYMLLAGAIGLVYSVVEKAVAGNPVSVILGLAIPMHIVWQFNQGGHIFEYEQAKAQGDERRARRELFLAIGVPFLLHGLWDSVLSIIAYCLQREDAAALQAVGGVLLAVALVGGVLYTIKTIRKVCATAKAAPDASARPAA